MKKLSLAILLCVLAVVTVVYAATPTQTVNVQGMFTDNSNNETGFHLYRCAGQGCDPTIRVTTLPANSTSFTDILVNDPGGQVYVYGLSAFNDAGESTKSTAVYTSPMIVVIPNAPGGILFTTVGTKIQ